MAAEGNRDFDRLVVVFVPLSDLSGAPEHRQSSHFYPLDCIARAPANKNAFRFLGWPGTYASSSPKPFAPSSAYHGGA
jgi:hypothetical protein